MSTPSSTPEHHLEGIAAEVRACTLCKLHRVLMEHRWVSGIRVLRVLVF